MGILDWLKGSKPMENKPVVEKKTTVPKKKPETVKPSTVKMVTNVTKHSEWIGNTEIKPGRSKLIDIGPNTIGANLIGKGVFVLGKQKIRETIIGGYQPITENGENPPTGGSNVSQGTFKCPWCGQNIEGQKEARKHFSLELVKALSNLPE